MRNPNNIFDYILEYQGILIKHSLSIRRLIYPHQELIDIYRDHLPHAWLTETRYSNTVVLNKSYSDLAEVDMNKIPHVSVELQFLSAILFVFYFLECSWSEFYHSQGRCLRSVLNFQPFPYPQYCLISQKLESWISLRILLP